MSPSALFEALSHALHGSETIVDKAASWASGHVVVVTAGGTVFHHVQRVTESGGQLVLVIDPDGQDQTISAAADPAAQA